MQIEVGRLLRVANPVINPPWNIRIDYTALLEMVFQKIDDHLYMEKPLGDNDSVNTRAHAMRIAYLVTHGWRDEIFIDVGIPSMGYVPEWPIEDGNHRLYAAWIMNAELISVGFSGEVEYGAALFEMDPELFVEEGPAMLPVDCIKCLRPEGPLHPVGADHAGWLCPECLAIVEAQLC